MQISQLIAHTLKFRSDMMKKDILANLYQKINV